MKQSELDEVLRKHQLWLDRKVGGKRANLRYTDLRGANLRYTDLRGADLSNADLRGANLFGAILRGANLRYTYLRDADLESVTISKDNIISLCNEILWFNVKCNKFKVKV